MAILPNQKRTAGSGGLVNKGDPCIPIFGDELYGGFFAGYISQGCNPLFESVQGSLGTAG